MRSNPAFERTLERMRTLFVVLAITFAQARAGMPHDGAADVSAFQVAGYRAGVGMGCRAEGRRLGHSPELVERRCKCLVDTLNAKLSEDDWRRATFLAHQKQDREEAQVFAPHMPAVRACISHAF